MPSIDAIDQNNCDHYPEVVAITDGTKWIILFSNNLFPRESHILDIFHAKENASKFVDIDKRGKRTKRRLLQTDEQSD